MEDCDQAMSDFQNPMNLSAMPNCFLFVHNNVIISLVTLIDHMNHDPIEIENINIIRYDRIPKNKEKKV